MSSALNVIKAHFGSLREVTTAPVWQYNYGQKLEIDGMPNLPSTFEIHYSNSKARGTAKRWIGYDGVVDVLDEYFRSGADIWGFIFLHEGEDDGETEYVIHIPVKERSEAEDSEPTPVQKDVVDEAISALNTAVTQTGEDKAATAALAEAAAASSLIATQAAQSAQWSAESASGSASTASTAAATATQKATEAATSAANAASSKTAAETAEANAQAAQSASESARTSAESAAQTATAKASEASVSATDAETAKTGAEAAQTAAEEARDETVAEAASIRGLMKDKADIIISTAEGTVATFEDGGNNMPMVSCVAKIEPVQSGSGDPSPDNVRPISGWTGCNVVVSPTNDAQDGTTYPISWQSEAGTVYGGTLDAVSGVLTVDRAMVDLGSLQWTLIGSSRFYTAFTPTAKVATTIAERAQGMICSCYPFSTNTGYADTMDDKSMLRGGNTNAQIMIKDTAYTDATSFKSAMSGVQLVYELATPETYQLTPVEVKTLLGQNNIWADTGDVEVQYRADTKLYIDTHQPEILVEDVQVNGISVVSQGVASIPVASPSAYGVTKGGRTTVSGTTPSITAEDGVQYICGEVATLDITLPDSGIVDVVFTSGSTATVLTVTPPTGQTVRWANGFDATSLEADTVYEINILNGLGAVMAWT